MMIKTIVQVHPIAVLRVWNQKNYEKLRVRAGVRPTRVEMLMNLPLMKHVKQEEWLMLEEMHMSLALKKHVRQDR